MNGQIQKVMALLCLTACILTAIASASPVCHDLNHYILSVRALIAHITPTLPFYTNSINTEKTRDFRLLATSPPLPAVNKFHGTWVCNVWYTWGMKWTKWVTLHEVRSLLFWIMQTAKKIAFSSFIFSKGTEADNHMRWQSYHNRKKETCLTIGKLGLAPAALWPWRIMDAWVNGCLLWAQKHQNWTVKVLHEDGLAKSSFLLHHAARIRIWHKQHGAIRFVMKITD